MVFQLDICDVNNNATNLKLGFFERVSLVVYFSSQVHIECNLYYLL